MTTLAITGATGFVGKRLLDRALAGGHHVRALTRRAQPPRDGVEWIVGALDTPAALAELVRQADAAIHVAGVVNAPDRAGFERGNIDGTRAIVAAATSAAVHRFVHVSSLAAREPGLSMYGWSKAGAEAVVGACGLDWTMVRPPAIYGPGDMDALDLFRAAKRGVVPLPPAGRLSVIAVDDLARLLLRLAQAGPCGSIYEADDGVAGGWSHADYARAIGEAVGRRVLSPAMPRALLSLGARIDRLLRGPHAKLTADRVAYYCHPDWVVSPSRRPPPELWQPQVETRVGLAATAAWYREQGLL